MADRWGDLLSEFNHIMPPDDLWYQTQRRAPSQSPQMPTRIVHAVVIATVVLAALGGMLFASLLHHDQTPSGRPTHQTKVGAETWLQVLVSDLNVRIPVARRLVERGQCFTPQWSYLVSPIYNDLDAYQDASGKPDPRVGLGRLFTAINNRCSVQARQGGVAAQERNHLLALLDRLSQAVAATGPVVAYTSPPAPSTRLLLSDLHTRIPIVRRMISNAQCGGEVERIASPIQTDANLILLYQAPRTHTLKEGIKHEPLLRLAPDFMRISGNCFKDVDDGLLSDQEQAALSSRLTQLGQEVNKALRPGKR